MFLFKVDGCTNYTVFNETDRAQGNASPPHNGSDDNLVAGWYRFQGAAGYRMAEKCDVKWHCGTEHPVWLSSAHPTVAEDEVKGEICHANLGNCCGWTKEILVKKCSGYYVYELKETPYLYRYCGNAGAGKLA